MSLIICQECKKEISSFVDVCPNCGFPLNKLRGQNTLYNIVLVSFESPITAMGVLRKVRKVGIFEASDIIDNVPVIIISGVPKNKAEEIKKKFDEFNVVVEIHDCQEYLDGVKDMSKYPEVCCPRCKSTAITTGSRGFSLVWGFLGSGSTVNRCGKCGYSWEPKK